MTGDGGGLSGSLGYALTTVEALDDDDDWPVKLFLSYTVPDLLLLLGSDLGLLSDMSDSLGTVAQTLPCDKMEEPDDCR